MQCLGEYFVGYRTDESEEGLYIFMGWRVGSMQEKNKDFDALARRYDRLAKRACQPDLKQQLSELADEWRRMAEIREQQQKMCAVQDGGS
jgi:hypothetical protein